MAKAKKAPVKASDLAIKALRPRGTDYELAIEGRRGLVVRVHPSGERTFRLRYRQDGVLKRIALDAITLAEATIEWTKRRGEVKLGEDPATVIKSARAAKALKRHADRSALTVEQLASEFIDRYAKRKKKTWRADEIMFRSAVLPHFGAIAARDIKRGDVIQLVDKIAARAPVRANRVLAGIRKMFAWAVEQEIVPSSPCVGVKPPGAETRRDRVLSDEELRALWNGLDKHAATDLRVAIQLQLLTAQRVGEVVASKWSEFDLDKREWTIPGNRTKNKRTHVVPLIDRAVVLLESLGKSGGFVFARTGKKTKHLRVDVTGHELSEVIRKLDLKAFGSHDLRRTVATRLAELRIPRVVIDALLNHVDRSVGAIYDRHSYADEKRAALEAWESKLSQILSGKKATVTPLRRTENRGRRGG